MKKIRRHSCKYSSKYIPKLFLDLFRLCLDVILDYMYHIFLINSINNLKSIILIIIISPANLSAYHHVASDFSILFHLPKKHYSILYFCQKTIFKCVHKFIDFFTFSIHDYVSLSCLIGFSIFF